MPQPILKYGISQLASDALRSIGITADRCGQSIGNAPLSAGVHAADGEINGQPYTAALDLRIRDLTLSEIRQLLDKLGGVGFACWYRSQGWDGANGSPHIHCVFAGVPSKPALQAQIRDYLAGRDGLKGHRPYTFHPPNQASIKKVHSLFVSSPTGIPDEEDDLTKTAVSIDGKSYDGLYDAEKGINLVPLGPLKPLLTEHGISIEWRPDLHPPKLELHFPKA